MILSDGEEIGADHLVFSHQPQAKAHKVHLKYTALMNRLSEVKYAGIARLPREELSAFLSTSAWFRIRDYTKHFNLSETAAHRHLSELCTEGVLIRTDEKRNRLYRLAGNE